MKQTILLLCCLIVAFSGFSQFSEDFSDGNLTDNPTWQGDTDRYTVNAAFELQNDDVESGTTYVATQVLTNDSATWEFYCRLDFNPSTSNQMRAYLNASQPDLSGELEGYFVQIGASGDTDAIELRRQDGSSSDLLLSSPEGSVATAPAIRIRVIRTNAQEWELLADLTGGTDFQSFGTAVDATYPFGQYFGFLNKYTSTRVDKFFFDDIQIAPLFMDEVPPALVAVTPVGATLVEVRFDEPVNPTVAENVANYSFNPAVDITNAQVDATDPTLVRLTVDNLANATDYSLTISNIEDLENNVAATLSASFFFVVTMNAEANDIIINEVMADPNPPVGLPQADFVELYNRSDKYIDLAGFTITDEAGGTGVLPTYIMAPDTYIIVCDEDLADDFTAFGEVVAVLSLPSFNNADDEVNLFDDNGMPINSIHYYDDWYRADNKDDGGWTLELINPNLYCLGGENWIASDNPTGGTPGAQNSVFNDAPDNTPPSLTSATAFSNQTVVLTFSETMDNVSANDVNSYVVNPGDFTPVTAGLDADGQTVLLTFSSFFENEQVYTITADGVSDCVGNAIGGANTASFAYYDTEPAAPYDIIINEIMAAPSPTHGLPEIEYVELYNRSDKAVNLQNYQFDEGSSSGNTLPFFILLPGHYVILQERSFENFNTYGDVIQLDGLALTNGGEQLALYDNTGQTIDAVFYDDDWYLDGRDGGGYSLERGNPENICTNGIGDWSSSLADAGGTPGTVNSILNTDFTDTDGPVLTKVYLDQMTPNQLVLTFDKAIDRTSLSDISNYTITPNDLSVNAVFLTAPQYREIVVQLSDMVPAESICTIELNMDISDCKGNVAEAAQTGRFALPAPIEPGDIVLNEILFNPYTNGSRFVELYNRSDKVFDIADLFLAKKIGVDSIGNDEPVETPCLLFPNDYVVLTPDPSDIRLRYTVAAPEKLAQTDVPSYDDRADVVVLMTYESLIIDELAYTNDFQNTLLDDENGVSIERINFNRPTQDIGNWHSAAATVGFATPTYQNSQYSERTGTTDGGQFMSITEKTFSPDEDGFEDALTIFYQTPEPGFLARIRIYDARGRLTRELNRQTLLAATGSLKWDGSTDNGQKANIGVYIVVAEFTHPNGTVRTDKETVVLATRLD